MFQAQVFNFENIMLEVLHSYFFYLIVLLIFCAIISFATYCILLNIPHRLTITENALLVIAHPDDECMFFSPVLLQTVSQGHGASVYLLCLSLGDHYSMGKVREKELYASCEYLGIPRKNIVVVNHGELPDNPDVEWNIGVIATELCPVVEEIRPEQIITFDSGGVSHHVNHIAISAAVRTLLDHGRLPGRCGIMWPDFDIWTQMEMVNYKERQELPGVKEVFYLDTVGPVRKFIGILDLPFSSLTASNLCLLSVRQVLTAMLAMNRHRSQLRWYRIAYVFTCRYMLFNTFTVQTAPIRSAPVDGDQADSKMSENVYELDQV